MSTGVAAPTAAFEEVEVTTKRRVTAPVRVYEPSEGTAPCEATVLALHGAGGWLPDEPVLQGLAAAGLRVVAPVWPAWSEHGDEDRLSDMWDFALHGWDVASEMGLLSDPGSGALHLMGHSMGGMIAAEMAAMAPQSVTRMALLCPAGMWLSEHPIPDIFAMLPYQLAEVLFASPDVGEEVLTGGADFSDNETLTRFMVARARQQGMAGKILFPIPNRRFSQRAYRVTVPTLLVWGRQDRLIPPVYADEWQAALPDAAVELVDGAGHMLPHEQPAAVVSAVAAHLRG
ncbi:alpha/beta fold hydrolase [Candidatus Poriferisodalis sp.]|uniref:alpha/beta fold hydrolase n=1 Tax=Candidatus Poriferisodalis sp. TaxID=3101277 RepID=UPI003B012980